VGSHTDTFDLGRLGLSSGEGRRVDLTVAVPSLELGGQTYRPADGDVPVRLDVSRMATGYSLRLRYSLRLSGPCMRCLEDAGKPFEIDAREVDQPGGGEEMTSPYVEGDELDLRSWTRDALALDLPTQIVCREDCRGICAECGANLNDDPEHRHERAPDARWAKLGELRFE
jgi:uncharacterized protein